MKRSTGIWILAFAFLFVFLAGCTCMVSGAGLWWLVNRQASELSQNVLPVGPAPLGPATSTPEVIRPTPSLPSKATATPQAIPGKPSETPEAASETPPTPPTEAPGALSLQDNLSILENAIVPVNDLIDLAERLEGKENLPRSLEAPPPAFEIGESRSFWVTDTNTNQNFQVQATLRYVTDHVYFWIDDRVSYNQRHLSELVDTFEAEIYPTNRDFFGSEWTPGVDADPHLYILYTTSLGGRVAGYFSPVDEYLPVVREDSNGHEMFLLSAEYLDLDEQYTYGVLAHEFQHMIHWYQDRNEESWMNEGFSELAAFLNGYYVGGADSIYTHEPDMQLTDWPSDNTTPHYGAAFLFMTYFLDRFGDQATQALVAEPANGMVSVDQVLAALAVEDPLRGAPIQADDVFADWVVASYLQDEQVGDGRYTYHNYPYAPDPSASEEIRTCPQEFATRDVSQYGADYISIRCRGDYTLEFEGSVQVGVLPADPYSGEFAFYSNRGDESDMTLTRSFDFREHSGPLTLSYWTWYDLEKDYDYLYLVASLDGEDWQILTTPSGTPEDPSGNSYGWGYNGFSGGGPAWIQEQVDISQFAGQEVLLRFEYVTDAAVNGEGFLLDDVAVPETGYFSDFEADYGGWEAAGFVRIQNGLPQTFRLALIRFGDTITVEHISLPADNAASIPLSIGGDVQEVVLVVSGTSRYTRQKAAYRFSIQP
jgi:hypothetical protein